MNNRRAVLIFFVMLLSILLSACAAKKTADVSDMSDFSGKNGELKQAERTLRENLPEWQTEYEEPAETMQLSIRDQWELENPLDMEFAKHAESSGGSIAELGERAYRYYFLWENELWNAYYQTWNAVNDNFEEVQSAVMRDLLEFKRYVETHTTMEIALRYSNALVNADISEEDTLHYENSAGYVKLQMMADAYKKRTLDLFATLESADIQIKFAANPEFVSDVFKNTIEELEANYEYKLLGEYGRSYEDEAMPLIAELPLEGIRLYSIKPAGMLLQIGTQHAVFDWVGGNIPPRRVFPKLMNHDFDGDGIDELAVILLAGTGTGLHMVELHIVEYNLTEGLFTDQALDAYALAELMQEHVSVLYDSENEEVLLDVYGNTITAKPRGETGRNGEPYNVGELSFTDIVVFYFEGERILLEHTIGFYDNLWATPSFAAALAAEVVYTDGEFSLTGISVSEIEYR